MRSLLYILLLSPALATAQLVTSPGSASSLVQDVLLGTGVTVSNITYSGPSTAIGKFTANNTNLGISSGVIITTGTIANTSNGPQGPNDSPNSGVNNGAGGYSRLSNLVGGNPTFNAAILEFDFVPYSDSVKFRYVFGSEEYPEFVGTPFNDVFAFFIAGPGIPGGIQNIARLPGGIPVAINNVNGGNPTTAPPVGPSNPGYFVYNGTGSDAPYNSSNTYIQYDGFTKVLEARAKVQCGQTYHLIISIADVGDGIYDSGIFLEANSLTSKIPVTVDYTLSSDAFGDGKTMAEGCVSTTVTLTREPTNLQLPLTVPIHVSGTATEGVDYDNIPNSVTFAPGQTTLNFTFNAFNDAIAEGIETIDLIFDVPDPCVGINPLPLNLQINDLQPVAVDFNDPFMLCPGDPVVLTAQPSGGAGPYTFLWSTGETTQSITVAPTTTTTYSVTVTDNCLHESATGSVQVTVPVYDPLTFVTSPDVVEICPYVPTDLVVTPSGGSGVYHYIWQNSTGYVLGHDSIQEVRPAATTYFTATVLDQCGDTAVATINYTITSPPLVLTMSPDQLICPGDSAAISVTATGGYGEYFYEWPHSGETTSTVEVAPEHTTTYEVIVSDECQTFTVSGETTVEVIFPTADFIVSSNTLVEDLPITVANLSSNAVSYNWDFGDGNTSTVVHPNNTWADPGVYVITLVATNEIGCVDSIQKLIRIKEEYWVYVPNAFTPDGDRFNNYFSASTVNIRELNVSIFNRWGEVVYTSDDVNFRWDGTYEGLKCQDGIYTYKISYISNSGEEDTIYGHVALLQ
jgi:gliding motility-associated-like protein